MKQLSSFLALNIDGGDLIAYTYNEIHAEKGELIRENVRKSFYVVDQELAAHINAIRDYIRANKLEV